jgi:ABC-type Zn uptake system ZnuABC Zn-binding protein ZnuA
VRAVVGITVALGLAVAGCATDPDRGQAPRTGVATLSVVTTTTQLADFARVVGGDLVTVQSLLHANVDPHDFEAAPADLVAIAQADVVVRNGAGLESWFDDTIAAAAPRGEVVDASAAIPLRKVHGDDDPHVWLDPMNAKRMIGAIAAALVGADPEHTATFTRNLAAYGAQLDGLDRDIRQELAGVRSRKIVTNHDAFGYYAARYGLDVVGSVLPSFDSQAELSAAGISRVVRAIRDEGVRAVFAETSLPPETAETIAAEAGVKVVTGERALYIDALGPAGSGADTYLTMMRHNTEVLVDALG